MLSYSSSRIYFLNRIRVMFMWLLVGPPHTPPLLGWGVQSIVTVMLIWIWLEAFQQQIFTFPVLLFSPLVHLSARGWMFTCRPFLIHMSFQIPCSSCFSSPPQKPLLTWIFVIVWHVPLLLWVRFNPQDYVLWPNGRTGQIEEIQVSVWIVCLPVPTFEYLTRKLNCFLFTNGSVHAFDVSISWLSVTFGHSIWDCLESRSGKFLRHFANAFVDLTCISCSNLSQEICSGTRPYTQKERRRKPLIWIFPWFWGWWWFLFIGPLFRREL